MNRPAMTTELTRKYNFNPGPALLPKVVLDSLRDSLYSHSGSGVGILETSHRSCEFQDILAEAADLLRSLLGFSDEYQVLFTTGGATAQFSMVPQNLLLPGCTGQYVLTGVWAARAAAEARKFGKVHIAASSELDGYTHIPRQLQLLKVPGYLHFTSNNTVYGTQYRTEPDSAGLPLVCDASSDILGREIQADRYALMYAGAQKNLGIAGVAVVVLHRKLLENIPDDLSLIGDYRTYADSQSLFNTPPTGAIFVLREMLRWAAAQGGAAPLAAHNRRKAALIYDVLDASEFYQSPVAVEARSTMNIVFRLPRTIDEDEFLKEAAAADLCGLRGHRAVGGIRASMYNAFPAAGAEVLAELMRDFERRRG